MSRRVRKFFKEQIANLKGAFGLTRQFTILLIGQTGQGKTSFLELLNSLAELTDVDEDATGEELSRIVSNRIIRMEHENLTAAPMESRTSDASIYNVSIEGLSLRIIDTPGVGDTRGLREDEEHTRRIVRCLQQAKTVNLVLLVINGTETRTNATVAYTLAKVASVMPRQILQQVAVVFTFTLTDKPKFDMSELSKHLDGTTPMYVCIDNPFALAHSHTGPFDEEYFELFRLAVSRTTKNVVKLFEICKGFDEVPTHTFQELLDKMGSICAELNNLIEAIGEEQSHQAAVKEAKETLQKVGQAIAAQRVVTAPRVFTRWRREQGQHHFYVCTYNNCHQNCHKCDLQIKSRVYRTIAGATDQQCETCGHGYAAHCISKEIWKSTVVEEALLPEPQDHQHLTAQKASTETLLSRLNDELVAIEERKRQREASVDKLLEDLDRIGVPSAVARLLGAQKALLEQKIEDEPDNQSLKTMLTTVSRHLEEIEKRDNPCPVCTEEAGKVKMYSCRRHGVCETCAHRLRQQPSSLCPTCRAPLNPSVE